MSYLTVFKAKHINDADESRGSLGELETTIQAGSGWGSNHWKNMKQDRK